MRSEFQIYASAREWFLRNKKEFGAPIWGGAIAHMVNDSFYISYEGESIYELTPDNERYLLVPKQHKITPKIRYFWNYLTFSKIRIHTWSSRIKNNIRTYKIFYNKCDKNGNYIDKATWLTGVVDRIRIVPGNKEFEQDIVVANTKSAESAKPIIDTKAFRKFCKQADEIQAVGVAQIRMGLYKEFGSGYWELRRVLNDEGTFDYWDRNAARDLAMQMLYDKNTIAPNMKELTLRYFHMHTSTLQRNAIDNQVARFKNGIRALKQWYKYEHCSTVTPVDVS